MIKLFLEDEILLGYSAVQSRWCRSTFQRCVLPPSSRRWWWIITLMMEAVRTSEASVCFNDTTRCNVPEGFHCHTRRCGNLKSHKLFLEQKVTHFYSIERIQLLIHLENIKCNDRITCGYTEWSDATKGRSQISVASNQSCRPWFEFGVYYETWRVALRIDCTPVCAGKQTKFQTIIYHRQTRANPSTHIHTPPPH
jgi:hypothetical protein